MSESLNTSSNKNRVLIETCPGIKDMEKWIYLDEVKVSPEMEAQMKLLFDAFKDAKFAPRGD